MVEYVVDGTDILDESYVCVVHQVNPTATVIPTTG